MLTVSVGALAAKGLESRLIYLIIEFHNTYYSKQGYIPSISIVV